MYERQPKGAMVLLKPVDDAHRYGGPEMDGMTIKRVRQSGRHRPVQTGRAGDYRRQQFVCCGGNVDVSGSGITKFSGSVRMICVHTSGLTDISSDSTRNENNSPTCSEIGSSSELKISRGSSRPFSRGENPCGSLRSYDDLQQELLQNNDAILILRLQLEAI